MIMTVTKRTNARQIARQGSQCLTTWHFVIFRHFDEFCSKSHMASLFSLSVLP